MRDDDVPDRPATQPEAPPRRPRDLLVDRSFGPFFFGKLASTLGMWVHNIAAAIVVFELTRSTLLVGMVSVAQFAPQLVLTPWSGARADRGDRRRQLLVGRLVTASGSGGLVLWILGAGLEGTTGAAAVIAAALVVGIGFALGGPAMSAVLPALVRPRELPAAVALSSVPFTIARASGPALGALLVTSLGAAAAFLFATATNLLFAAVIAVIAIRPVHRPVPVDGSVRAGVRHLRVDPVMAALLAGVATIGVGADPVITLTPAIAAGLGTGSEAVGLMASAFGVGAGLAFLTLGVARRRAGLQRLGSGGLLLLAAGMVGLAASPTLPLAITALLIGGSGMTYALTSLTTLIQERVPEELRGRIMALWAVAFLGSRPLTAGVTGAIADAISVEAALLIVAGVLLVGARASRPTRITAPASPAR